MELDHTSKEKALKTLNAMYLTRFADDKMSKLVKQNKGGTFHLSVIGHEMVGAVCSTGMIPGQDWALPYYRDRAMAIGLGCTLVDLFGSFLAREVPHHSGGRMMPEHFSHKALNIPVQSSCVGSQFLHAVGVAKGLKLQGKTDVVYVSAGDGATSQGDFHESLNFACIHALNILFVIQNNGWAISVPAEEQTAGGDIVSMTSGYKGLTTHDVDGCNYDEMRLAVEKSVEKGRKNLGPSLIVATVPRIGAHSNSDDPTKYKSQEDVKEDKERDPLPLMEKWILSHGVMNEAELSSYRQECMQKVEEAAQLADLIPFPDPAFAHTKVFAEAPLIQEKDEESSSSGEEAVVIVDALNHALQEEMRKDPTILVFGQDVAHGKGGVFGVTRHLTELFGKDRCFNTPLAESTIIALAIGLSFVGWRPVAEIQFADYVWTGINQLFNELANVYYRSNGEWRCPVVIRMPYGGYIQGGPYHSQSIEAFLAHCPGLKVVIPSNAADAKKLFKASLRDPNPVVFLEHKALYRQRVFSARKETGEEELAPLGKAKVVKQGSHLTVVVWGALVFMSVQVADKLALEGISVEIIDLRTIVPLDMETVVNSVKKTGKCLIAHEAPSNAGFGAEISARLVEEVFAYLDAPIMRVTGQNCMVPYCKALEDKVLPQLADLETAIRKLANF
ncbi:MAG: thiamine pyrophosphate-dependent enzyme [Chlamydiota bacterium]